MPWIPSSRCVFLADYPWIWGRFDSGDRRQVHPIGSFRRKVHHLLNSRNVLPMCCQCAAIGSQDCDCTYGNDGSIVALQHPLMPNAFSVIVDLSTM